MKKLHKFQIFKKSDKMKQNIAQKTDSGRSMVEILGVLAVIGVLTLGGVQGYRFAMTKWRANDIANEVNLRNRDTWNMYQTKELPDEDELTTWSDRTSTGFPIHVFPQTKMIYDVQVENVPTRVCRQTLDMSLQGALFIWTTPDDGTTKRIYRGNNPEICGEEGEEVTLVFTTSLEQFGREGKGLHNPVDERGQPLRYCLENSDCRSCETCYKNEPYTCQSTCPDDKPVCMEKVGQACKCVECELTSDCGTGKVCDDATNTCQEIQEECPDGTFRSRNGACVPCNEATNVIISSEKFTAPGIEDEKTGEEMCDACATAGVNQTPRNKEVDKNGIMYCSYGCTKGVSFQTITNGCAPCYDRNGNPTTGRYQIANGDESITQCTACEGHFWFMDRSWPNPHYCEGSNAMCAEGYLRRGNPSDCELCTDFEGVIVTMSIASGDAIKNGEEMCKKCPNFYYWSNSDKRCFVYCKQPADEEESIRICQEEGPSSANCKRRFMQRSGNCHACNTTSVIYVGTDSSLYEYQSCLNCGRMVDESGNCVFKPEECALGKFRNSSGKCVDCSLNDQAEIKSEEDSKCVANCKKKDGVYSADDDAVATRHILNGKCWPVCGENKINPTFWGGGCTSCAGKESIRLNSLTDPCEEKCSNHKAAAHWGNFCTPKDCGTGYYKRRYGECTECTVGNGGDEDIQDGTDGSVEGKQLCEKCGNRILVDGDRCRQLNPGTSGVCNNIDTVVPELADKELKNKAEPYLKGNYNTILYRSSDGYCRRCDDKTTRASSLAQCKSCGNRRYESGNCVYGLCTEKVSFLNTSLTCVSCSTGTVRTQIVNSDAAKRLCDSCEEKRTMTGVDDAVYCVKDCESGLWQDINGNCRSYTYNTVSEIGTDETSRNLCHNAGHLAYPKKDGNDKTHWYCSQLPVKGKFINANGTLTTCTAASTEIPNTQNAKNLCLGTAEEDIGCDPDQRKIEEVDGKIMCSKA